MNINELDNLVKEKGSICLYHSDLDGAAAAHVVLRKYPNTKCIPVNHGKVLHWEQIIPDAVVFIVDFTFGLTIMQKLQREHHLVWCDHHDLMIDHENAGFTADGIRKIEAGISGATLIWNYLYPEGELPLVIKLVADYDTWSFKSKHTEAFVLGVHQLPYAPIEYKSKDIWDKLFTKKEMIELVISVGNELDAYIKERNKIISSYSAFKTTIEGKPAIAINMRNSNSKILDSVCDDTETPYRILFSYTGSMKQYRVSLYSVDGEKYPTTDIVRKYGGGGREGCGGFTIDKLPFAIPDNKVKDTDWFLDALEELHTKETTANIIRAFIAKEIQPVVMSSMQYAYIVGHKAVMINHPALSGYCFYATGLNFQQDLGVLWSITKNGDYVYRIYVLNPALDIQSLGKVLDGKVRKDYLIVTSKVPMFN